MTVSNADNSLRTVEQVSAGGVVFRKAEGGTEVVIVAHCPELRWQLPKGIIDAGETPEQAALREVREESGMTAQIVAPIQTIDYWFIAAWDGVRNRFHKFVHFYLMAHQDGDGSDHDHEVDAVRWLPIEEALRTLEFKSERDVVKKAGELIREMSL